MVRFRETYFTDGPHASIVDHLDRRPVVGVVVTADDDGAVVLSIQVEPRDVLRVVDVPVTDLTLT